MFPRNQRLMNDDEAVFTGSAPGAAGLAPLLAEEGQSAGQRQRRVARGALGEVTWVIREKQVEQWRIINHQTSSCVRI